MIVIIKKTKKIGVIIVTIVVLLITNLCMREVDASEILIFKDKNLFDALCKNYNFEGEFSKEDAERVSHDKSLAVIENAKISDLEGLQYFTYISTLYVGGNDLYNLKPLSRITWLGMLDISNNSIKGKSFEKSLNEMGRINKLGDLNLSNNGLTSISFLKKIGNIKNYTVLDLSDNKIGDISVLKNATKLYTLDMSDNRITDVTPLENLDKLTFYLDLRDNCIIDYSPVKHLLDKMYQDIDPAACMDRYDYYINPVNFKYDGKKINFPYLTVYYECQGYAEAIPLLEALGGSATYDKESGTLTCEYDGNVLVMTDFSKKYTVNGKKKNLSYPMRRMQYDLAYVPVKDICDVLGLDYNVIETRDIVLDSEEVVEAPKLVEIRKSKKELG